MWKLFRRKHKKPVANFHMLFNVTYRLSNGKERASDPIAIIVPAATEEEAERILKALAVKRVEIKIISKKLLIK
jgi:hypothetical protein